MIRSRSMAALALVLGLAATPSMADDAPIEQFGGTAVVQIDPATAYITYRTPAKTVMRFLRAVTSEERTAYDQKRTAAYAKAHKRYENNLAQWKIDEPNWQKDAKRGVAALPEPQKPEEVTEENFSYPAAELDHFVVGSMGPQFDKGVDSYTYLIAVKPGTYTIYGQVFGVTGAAFGTCLCMGSVKFEAVAGKVTDLGQFLLPQEAGYPPEQANGGGLLPMVLVPSTGTVPAGRLSGMPVVGADFHAADKMPNYFGILIDRLPAIPGILGYDRDRIVDLRASAAGEARPSSGG
jgi:hypothetical protein